MTPNFIRVCSWRLMKSGQQRFWSMLIRKAPAFAKWAIGRAFRHAGDQASIEATLAKMIHDESPETRIAGSSFAVGNRREIRETASQRLRSTIRLPTCGGRPKEPLHGWSGSNSRSNFCKLEKTRGGPAWSYLEAVVELADPWLLNTRGDPLFLWDRILGKPPAFKKRASELIRQRIEDMKREADEADRATSR